ncbi:MAG TPA: class I SAM-dependent methyltransferase [Armatimonadota bacterium]
MIQNIYDNPAFFAGYSALRATRAGLNEALEQPAMASLLPDVAGLAVLDLGCGAGDLCRQLHAAGAVGVTGVDVSSRMLNLARAAGGDGIRYVHQAIEDFDAPDASFDLVVSSLAFHYVRDFEAALAGIARWLRPGGTLVFSQEHPVCTAAQGTHPGWARDERGAKRYWTLDRYHDEGMRESHWFVDGVIKYHRTTATILNALLDQGFRIQRVLEPHAVPEEEARRPELLEERRRPPFLLVKAELPRA